MPFHPLPGRGRHLPRAAAAGTLALALSSALLAGCGGGSKDTGSAPGSESTTPSVTTATIPLPNDQPLRPACGLLTQAEVESALGVKVAAGREAAVAGRSSCAYTLATAADQSVLIVSTSSSGVPAAFTAAQQKADRPQSVTAGEQAFVSGAQALVRKGNTMVAILVAVRQQPAQLTAAATKLAQAVATHL